jgi:hypothetical protein
MGNKQSDAAAASDGSYPALSESDLHMPTRMSSRGQTLFSSAISKSDSADHSSLHARLEEEISRACASATNKGHFINVLVDFQDFLSRIPIGPAAKISAEQIEKDLTREVYEINGEIFDDHTEEHGSGAALPLLEQKIARCLCVDADYARIRRCVWEQQRHAALNGHYDARRSRGRSLSGVSDLSDASGEEKAPGAAGEACAGAGAGLPADSERLSPSRPPGAPPARGPAASAASEASDFEIVEGVRTVRDAAIFQGPVQIRRRGKVWHPWRKRYAVLAADGRPKPAGRASLDRNGSPRRRAGGGREQASMTVHLFRASSCLESERASWLFLTACSEVQRLPAPGEGGRAGALSISLRALRVRRRAERKRSTVGALFARARGAGGQGGGRPDVAADLKASDFCAGAEEELQLWCETTEARDQWHQWLKTMVGRAKNRLARRARMPRCVGTVQAVLQSLDRTASGGDPYAKVCSLFMGDTGAAPLVITPSRGYANPPTEVATAARTVVVTTYGAFDVGFFKADGSPNDDPNESLRVETVLTEILRVDLDGVDESDDEYSGAEDGGGGRGSAADPGEHVVRSRRVLHLNMPDVEMYGNVLDVMGMPAA